MLSSQLSTIGFLLLPSKNFGRPLFLLSIANLSSPGNASPGKAGDMQGPSREAELTVTCQKTATTSNLQRKGSATSYLRTGGNASPIDFPAIVALFVFVP